MPALRRPGSHAARPSRLLRPRRRTLALAALLLLPVASLAQGPDEGAIYGVVEDAQGHRLVGLEVTLRGIQVSPASTTGPDGTFLVPHLAPGDYVLAVLQAGQARLASQPLTVVPGETLTLRAKLLDAAITLATDGVSDAGTALPDENDDGLDSAHGLTPMQNGALLDGATATQSYGAVPVGTGRNPVPDPDGDADSADATTGPPNGMARGRHAGVAYVYAQAAVREFRVAGQSYSAQLGRAGEVATTVSRAGTSEWHGSGFFVLRSQLLAASSPLAIATSYSNGVVSSGEVKPHDLRQRFGATVSGPLLPRRPLVFLYALERQQRGFPAVSSPANPNFYNITPTQSILLGTRGLNSAQVNAGLSYLSSLTGLTPRRADQTLNFARVDWPWRKQLTPSLEYNAVRWTAPAGLIDAPVVARGRASLGNAAGSLDQAVLRVTGSFSAHLSNQVRISFLRDLQYETPQTPLAQEPAVSPGGFAPEVNIAPQGLLFGTPAALSQQAYPDERRWQLADALTLVHRRHLIEIGGEVAFVTDNVATLANAAGTFLYDSTSGGGLVDFLTDYTFNPNATLTFGINGGCPRSTAATHLSCFRSYSQSFGEAALSFSTAEWSGFAEDTWHPRAGLTVRAGLRYEYTLLPLPRMPNAELDTLFGSRGATSVFPEDRNNFGPRLAVSYEPFGAGHGVVRAGFGVFYGRVPGATVQSALSDTSLPGSTVRIRIVPSARVACPQTPSQGFGYPCVFASPPSGVSASATSAMVFDRDFRLPMVQQGSLSIEHSVARGTRLTAAYVLNLDRQLPGSTDLNIAPSTGLAEFQLQGGTGARGVQNGETFLLPVYTSRVSPDFGPVTDIVSHGNASYNGLTLTAESQASATLAIRADYVWSKAIDYGQNQSATPRTDSQLDPYSNGYDKGLSSLNYPWSLRMRANWLPKLEAAPRWLRRGANGWKLTPIVAAHSGRPYTLDLSGGTYLSGGHESLNGSGGALYLPTVGRNTLRLPATVNVDLRAQRGFRAGRTHLLAAVEAFNLFNHQNVSSVTQRAFLVGTAAGGITPLVFQSATAIAAEGLTAQPFGTPTGAATSLTRERQVQVGIRAEF